MIEIVSCRISGERDLRSGVFFFRVRKAAAADSKEKKKKRKRLLEGSKKRCSNSEVTCDQANCSALLLTLCLKPAILYADGIWWLL